MLIKKTRLIRNSNDFNYKKISLKNLNKNINIFLLKALNFCFIVKKNFKTFFWNSLYFLICIYSLIIKVIEKKLKKFNAHIRNYSEYII